jgi:hypothetical protein
MMSKHRVQGGAERGWGMTYVWGGSAVQQRLLQLLHARHSVRRRVCSQQGGQSCTHPLHEGTISTG